MAADVSYWTGRAISRRTALRGAAAGAGGMAVAGLTGCRGSKPSAGTNTGSAASSAALDTTKGKPGGVFMATRAGFPASLDLTGARQPAAAQFAGLVHSGLLGYRCGRQGVDGTDISVEPDVCQAMPEQPDPLTYIFKIIPGIKFHNGRVMTPEDIKYSIERYAFSDKSAFRDSYTWADKVDTPDTQTVVIKTKAPYADAVQALAMYNDPFILAKEFEEGPEVNQKQMGTGPYLWSSYQPGVLTTFKRNPDYFKKPYPYFDEIRLVGATDDAKKFADFASKGVNLTWWSAEEQADQIEQARPDAHKMVYPASGYAIVMRVDQPPFNDKRVRQALSMAIDRKQIRDAVSKGRGEDDQDFSIINKPWGFRRPKELKAAKNWNFDPAEAKKLLAAAGIDKPIETIWTHWDASATGQTTIDMATLTQAKYRELGIANVKDVTVNTAVYFSTVNIGQFDQMAHGPNQQNVVLGNYVRNKYWSPPEGIKGPSPNVCHVNNPQLSQLMDKQVTQFNRDERKATFREIEEIVAEEQYRIILSSYTQTWFADQSVKNIQVPIFAYNGAWDYARYWWFDKA